jgi:hypothetical protein
MRAYGIFYINAYNILVLVGIAGCVVAPLYKYMWTYCKESNAR